MLILGVTVTLKGIFLPQRKQPVRLWTGDLLEQYSVVAAFETFSVSLDDHHPVSLRQQWCR